MFSSTCPLHIASQMVVVIVLSHHVQFGYICGSSFYCTGHPFQASSYGPSSEPSALVVMPQTKGVVYSRACTVTLELVTAAGSFPGCGEIKENGPLSAKSRHMEVFV